jgi:5'/3'-nucleotidase
MTALRILVTNDDGIAAPGLRHLAQAVLEAGHHVTVAAPSEEASGSSAAMSAVERDGRVVAENRDLGLDGVKAYAVGGTPAFIARLGIQEAFGPRPDVIFSGVNRGANIGRAVLHSGTVGAALTGASAGLRGVAASLDVLTAAVAAVGSGGAALGAIDRADDERRQWSTPAHIAVDLLPALMAAPAGIVFNINAPDVVYAELKGVREARLARFGQVEIVVAERAMGYVRTSVVEEGRKPEPGTDLAVLADGFASVTVIRSVSEVAGVTLHGVVTAER